MRYVRSSGWVLAVVALVPMCVGAQGANAPWKDKTLSADRRAELVVKAMTLDEKIRMVHGIGWGVLRAGDPVPADSNHGAGYVPGIARLGIPKIDQADSAVGIRQAAYDARYATLLPSVIGLASSWDLDAADLYGKVIGRELRAWGTNMSIGGGMDLTREPRNGRNFEYAGEDPVLAGNMVGQLAMGVQSQHVMGDIKHYALNDQETGRTTVNVLMDKRTMRETDLLAFEIAIKKAQPAAVMCSYNLVNGEHACENDYLLNEVLKKEWGFKGFVVSDWEGTHSAAKAANAGLDMEMPGEDFFGKDLRKAVEEGKVPMARLDDMCHRILRSMFATGVIDDPFVRKVVDPFQGRDDARHIAEESIVLLKNDAGVLPLKAGVRKIVLIGGHADVGVLSGSGSAQVDPPGGDAVTHEGSRGWQKPVYFPSSPMKAIQKLAPGTEIVYVTGTDKAEAARMATGADVAIVFATQPMSEGHDAATLALPDAQDDLIASVAAANPHTVVVLETGGPVSMPWVGSVRGVMEAWFPGIGGGEAIADLLFGAVNPSGKLSITFPKGEADLPLPAIPGIDKRNADGDVKGVFDMSYKEGLALGYRWYEVSGHVPLFAFGHGLSYTTYKYSGLKVSPTGVQFQVTNTGAMAGAEVAQMYVRLPAAAGEPFQRLAGWSRVRLGPGETKTVTLPLDHRYISVWDVPGNRWQLVPGDYGVHVGGASDDAGLRGTVQMR